MLAKWFLGRAIRELSSKVKGFSPQALVAIKRFRWPGNIRQLENRIKKAVVLAEKPLISPDDMELRPEQLEPILPLTAGFTFVIMSDARALRRELVDSTVLIARVTAENSVGDLAFNDHDASLHTLQA